MRKGPCNGREREVKGEKEKKEYSFLSQPDTIERPGERNKNRRYSFKKRYHVTRTSGGGKGEGEAERCREKDGEKRAPMPVKGNPFS